MSAEAIAKQTEEDDLPRLPTWKYLGKLAGSRPWMVLLHVSLNIITFAVGSQVMGLITREFFDALTGDAPATFSPYTLSAFVIATAMGRVAFLFGAVSVHVSNRFAMAALLRKNMFSMILDRPGARAVPGSPGEAISRFRGDVNEFSGFVCELFWPISFGVFALVAMVIMLNINARIASIVFFPWSW